MGDQNKNQYTLNRKSTTENFEKHLKNMAVWAGVVVILGILLAGLVFYSYYSNLRHIIVPQDVSNMAGVLLGISGAILAFIALYNSVKTESEMVEKKITEKNIERDLTRRELIAAYRNTDLLSGLLRKTLFYGIMPNAIQLKEPSIIDNYVRRQIQEIDHLLKDFVAKGGHLKDVQDVVSNYEGIKVVVPHKELGANSSEILKILKVIEDIGIDCDGIEKSSGQQYKCNKCEFSSDHILRKVNELRFDIFMLDQLLTYTKCFDIQGNSIVVSKNFENVFDDFMRRFYELYLLVRYNVLIEYQE